MKKFGDYMIIILICVWVLLGLTSIYENYVMGNLHLANLDLMKAEFEVVKLRHYKENLLIEKITKENE